MTHYTKGTPSPRTSPQLRLLVGVRFQVLFHSPRRGAFHLSLTVLCSLSVMYEYLGLEGGPPMFRQDFTCPALLNASDQTSHTGLSPILLSFPSHSGRSHGSAGPRSLATTNGVSLDFLSSGYLDVSVPRVCS